MAKFTRQINDFSVGMTPFINGDGLYKISGFDTKLKSLKPYHDLYYNEDDTTGNEAIYKIVKAIGVTSATAGSNLFAMAKNYDTAQFNILEWDVTQGKWSLFKASGTTSNYGQTMAYYGGKFIGICNGNKIWTVTKAAVDLAAFTLPTSYTGVPDVDFLIHSKDNYCYIPANNIIYQFTGSAVATGVTLPSTFTITSLAERGDFIMIVGYDTALEESYAYLWDRDTSLNTLTAKYELGAYQALHNATLDGIDFVVSQTWESGNTVFSDDKCLVIGYLTQDKYKIIKKYDIAQTGDIEGKKFVSGDSLYFTTDNSIMRLDSKGNLFIEQSTEDANESGFGVECLIKEGDGFYLGLNSLNVLAIGLSPIDSYLDQSFIETTRYKSTDKTKNLDFVGAIIETEAMPTAGQVTVKTRANEENSWTTIATLTADNEVKHSIVNDGNIGTSKTRQFRIESTGGAEITGYQFDLEEVNDETYG